MTAVVDKIACCSYTACPSAIILRLSWRLKALPQYIANVLKRFVRGTNMANSVDRMLEHQLNRQKTNLNSAVKYVSTDRLDK